MRKWKPIFVENSWVPRILSFISPISIGAITLGFIVFSRGEMDEVVKRHETIHFQQFLETGFIGFLILYFYDWIKYSIRFRSGTIGYYNIRAEREAYDNEEDSNYLAERERWKWIKQNRI